MFPMILAIGCLASFHCQSSKKAHTRAQNTPHLLRLFAFFQLPRRRHTRRTQRIRDGGVGLFNVFRLQ
jgi:hypothetical protein